MAQQTNDFSQGSIPKNILALALPMTLAQLINVLYSVVDRIYLGLLPGHLAPHRAGTDSAGDLHYHGLCQSVRHRRRAAELHGAGTGKPRGSGTGHGNAFTLLLIFGAAVTALFLVIKRPMLYLFGASDATYPYADAYMTIYLMGTLFVMIGLGMNPFINAQGFGKVGMMTVGLGAVVNIVLDPVFIFSLTWASRGRPWPQ